jgi:zinc protease
MIEGKLQGMKRLFLFCVATWCFLCMPALAQSKSTSAVTAEAHAGGISSYTLSNGFKIILIPYPSAPNTRVELLVRSGSKLEGYGETGMAHLLEHMLFKGAGDRQNIKDDLTKLGARYNGTTSQDRTNYFETVDADPQKIDQLIHIEADRFIRARFTAADLASEMTVVRNELENSEKEPSQLVLSALARHGFNWHGYSRATIGSRSDIEGASFAALQAFHRKHYRPDNAALIISGKFEPQRVLALASQLFAVAQNPPLEKPANWTLESSQTATTKSEISLSAGTTIAASAWKLPGVKERDAHALDLAAATVCDGDWGSLRKDIVLERKLAVSASCFTWNQTDYGRFIVFARADQKANADALSQELVKHIQDAAARGVSQAQLDRARLSELNKFQNALTSHEAVARLVSEAEAAGDWRLFLWERDVIASVTLDEANAALKKWLVPTNRNDVVLRHAEASSPLVLPKPTSAEARVKGQSWPNLLSAADPAPTSLLEIAKSTVRFDLGGQNVKAALIQRQTQGDRVWLSLENDYGNFEQLKNRKTSCDAASALMAYGGNGMTRDALSARMEKLQAIWQVNLAGIYLEVPRKNFAEAFQLLMSSWADPLMPVVEFGRYKASRIAALEAGLLNPIAMADNDVRLRFDNFPGGHWGQPKTYPKLIQEAKNLNYQEVLKCSQDFAKLSQARVGVVGNISAQDMKDLWAKTGLKNSAPSTYERVPMPSAPATVDVKQILVAMPDKTNAKVTGTTVVPIQSKSEDFPALQLAVFALGGNSSSLIWQQLRETQGLAYSSGMQLAASSFDDRSTIQLYATASSSNADKALASLQAVLSKVLTEGLTSEQLEKAKSAWMQKRKVSLGDESQFASILVNALYDGRDFEAIANLDEKINGVDRTQANAAIRKYVDPSKLLWAVGKGE